VLCVDGVPVLHLQVQKHFSEFWTALDVEKVLACICEGLGVLSYLDF
jgi:hypothetical protein